jgi:hypothetical protein
MASAAFVSVSPLGYEEYTDRFYDPEFGWLTPKRKFMR